MEVTPWPQGGGGEGWIPTWCGLSQTSLQSQEAHVCDLLQKNQILQNMVPEETLCPILGFQPELAGLDLKREKALNISCPLPSASSVTLRLPKWRQVLWDPVGLQHHGVGSSLSGETRVTAQDR